MQAELIIFYLLLIDSIGANLIAWFGEKWYTKHFHFFARLFPAIKGWAFYYLILVIWIGSLSSRLG